MQCEGWRRRGGALTLGPVEWKQCPNDGVVMMQVKQKGVTTDSLPACMECWNEAIETSDIEVLEVTPIAEPAKEGNHG